MSRVHECVLNNIKYHGATGATLPRLTYLVNMDLGSGMTAATISARIRDLRKDKHGGHKINRVVRNKLHYYSLGGPNES